MRVSDCMPLSATETAITQRGSETGCARSGVMRIRGGLPAGAARLLVNMCSSVFMRAVFDPRL